MTKMKVFLSWSGSRSKHVAAALKEWIPDVLQNTSPFFSQDMPAGTRWFETIGRELEASDFAILCITRENAKAPWINFEAGACGKKLDHSRVVPYLVDGKPTDYEPPLSMFQSVLADEGGTFSLLGSLNEALGENGLARDRLERLFGEAWPRYRATLESIPGAESDEPARSAQDMFAEILALLRNLDVSSPAKDTFFTLDELQILEMHVQHDLELVFYVLSRPQNEGIDRETLERVRDSMLATLEAVDRVRLTLPGYKVWFDPSGDVKAVSNVAHHAHRFRAARSPVDR